MELEIPAIQASPYHKPFVAVWLETPERKALATLAVWYDQDQWLKDLRQWWRKLGRKGGVHLDAVSGATRKPGVYTLVWQARDNKGQPLAPGDYLLNVEASREEGDRSYVRTAITLGEKQKTTIEPSAELGKITIKTE